MILENKKIFIATLIRDRSWILPHFLKYLYELNYNKKDISIFFLINNSKDDSYQIIQNFRNTNLKKYLDITIENIDIKNIPDDVRTMNVRNNYIYNHLANMRNIILDRCNKNKFDYIFSIDSDILLINKDTLNNLISHKKDIISSIIYNGYEFKPELYYRFTNALIKVAEERLIPINKNKTEFIKSQETRYKHLRKKNGLIEVDLTGAIYLINTKILRDIKYGYHIDGEDAYFCNSAQQNKIKLYCDMDTYNQHIMSESWLNKFLDGEKIN